MSDSEHPTAAARALAAVPFLAPLDPVDLAKLAGVLEDCWFDAGTVVFEVGGQGDALYILREGLAERRVANSRVGLIHPPEVFGELALLTDQPRSSSVVALTPIRVWVLPKHRVHMLLRAEPELMLAMSRAIGMELARARRALGELQHELEQWVAERMAALAPEQRALIESAAMFEMPPSRALARLADPRASAAEPPSRLADPAPLLRQRDGSYSMPTAIRDVILRRMREVAEALGYSAGGRAATGLALASFVSFGQMAALFLTGSSVGLLVHGLLPAAIRAEFDFARWFLAALPLHAVLLIASLTAILALYRPEVTPANVGDRLALQRAVLGPMRREEKVCVAVLVGLIAGFLAEPLHGIHGAWLGVAALAALAVGGALDTTMLRTGVNWPFLVFFGVITSVATVFQTLRVDAWLASRLAGPIGALASSSLLFCVALTLVGFALSFVIRWQAAAPLLTLVALPVAGAAHVNPFLVALICLVATQVWFLPYQSTVYLAFYHGSGELFSHRHARPFAWLWGPLVLIAVVAAWPVWRVMGLVG